MTKTIFEVHVRFIYEQDLNFDFMIRIEMFNKSTLSGLKLQKTFFTTFRKFITIFPKILQESKLTVNSVYSRLILYHFIGCISPNENIFHSIGEFAKSNKLQN